MSKFTFSSSLGSAANKRVRKVYCGFIHVSEWKCMNEPTSYSARSSCAPLMRLTYNESAQLAMINRQLQVKTVATLSGATPAVWSLD